jgi:phosphoribosylformylglycinamidine synthase subunit PurL
MSDFISIDIINADDNKLKKISSDNLLSLTLDEMKQIKKYYLSLKRNPTDVELETIAQTWSEHCKHKTLRGLIEYEYIDEKTKKKKKKIIDNLLKQTIVKSTNELNKKWCLSTFVDNAGIIEFDKDNGVAFKVETHNHPSALEPYGGAGTGIGGVIRDILGVGLGAKPIFNTDVFCFGYPDEDLKNLPKGVLHPKRIMKGVVSGVRDYGNRMGIPTINGAVLFDRGYTCNPLVYCGTCGIIPKNKINKKVSTGDYILAVGGRTGRDGIHGATFSSLALDENTESSAVQIGNPIVEKKVLDTLLKARDKNLYSAITDCGAGGFSSAIGELAELTGAIVYLDKAPLKYQGLLPWEIWVSEAQERMVLAVPPENIDEIIKIFNDEEVEAVVLGKFTNTKKLELFYHDQKVCDLSMKFLHDGVPRLKRSASWKENPKTKNNWKEISKKDNFKKILRDMLSHPNVCTKEWIIRQYDHEVQGGSIIKPLQGKYNDGPGDASVCKPLYNSFKGVVVSNGINTNYGKIDPYWMTLANIDEALRNIVCVGGNLDKTAMLDNFCWGDPQDKHELGGIVRASNACYDGAKGFGVPFISGKDSLNNTYLDSKKKKTSIPASMLISVISVMEDVRCAITMYFKSSGNLIYIVGETKNELGGSLYAEMKNKYDCRVPQVNIKTSKKTMDTLSRAINKGLVLSCHDSSEGGFGVAVSEMCFAGEIGAKIFLDKIPVSKDVDCDSVKLFSESCSRFIVEVKKENAKKFETAMKGANIKCIGETISNKEIIFYTNKDKVLFKDELKELKKSFQTVKWE